MSAIGQATDGAFATCGVDHVHFWWRKEGASSEDPSSVYYRERGLLCGVVPAQAQLCVCAVGAKVVSGCASGHLLVWEGRTCSAGLKHHAGAVTALCPIEASPDGARASGLISGCSEGKVIVWTALLEPTTTFDLQALGPVKRDVRFARFSIRLGF